MAAPAGGPTRLKVSASPSGSVAVAMKVALSPRLPQRAAGTVSEGARLGRMARLWAAPADTATKPALVGVLFNWLRSLLPQAAMLPSGRRATPWSVPADTAT